MTQYDDDILEYSKAIERLQNENLQLKKTLLRFKVFGENTLSQNLYDIDLTANLHHAEKMFAKFFDTLMMPAFVAEIVADDYETVTDFVFTKVNNEFCNYCHLDIHSICGKCNSEIKVLKSDKWLPFIDQVCRSLRALEMNIEEGNYNCKVSMFSIQHNQFVAHFVPHSLEINDNSLKP